MMSRVPSRMPRELVSRWRMFSLLRMSGKLSASPAGRKNTHSLPEMAKSFSRITPGFHSPRSAGV